MQQVAVLDMSRNEARDAVHVTDQPIEEGQAVTAAVDWDRRFDHMQQHTGLWAPMLCFLLLSLSQRHAMIKYCSSLLVSCCHQLGLVHIPGFFVSKTTLQSHAYVTFDLAYASFRMMLHHVDP